jgi:hypothetical protein
VDPSALRAYSEAASAALKQVLETNKGSGFTVDDPVRLGPIHKLVAAQVEMALVMGLFGEQDRQWFNNGRKYHRNGTICEQVIRLSPELRPKPPNAIAGQNYSVFFDISELSDSVPISDEIKQFYSDTAHKLPVPDAAFASRFPLIEVKGRDAAEAARIIAAHLTSAKALGWTIGNASALVDNWRNEYELTKGSEKTVIRFDMRPSLFGDTALNLTALTLIAGTSKLEDVIRRFAACKSWPQAFAAEGMRWVEASAETISQKIAESKTSDIAYDLEKRTFYWNEAAVKNYSTHKARLVGEQSSFEMLRNDLSFFLISAKGNGWAGADNLFGAPRSGFITLKLNEEQTIIRSDAASLSTILANLSSRMAEADPDAQLIKDCRQLVRLASEGGFHIRLLTPEQPKIRSFTLPQQPVGSKSKTPLRVKFIATIYLLAMPACSALAYYFTHSVLVAIGAFFLPILMFKLWGLWLILDANRLLRESRQKFPDD